MTTRGSPGYAAIVASAAAGPVFLASLGAAIFYLQMPRAIAVEELASAALGLAIVIPAFLVGFVLAIMPNVIGAAVMATLSESFGVAREPAIWVMAGGLAGAGIAALTSGFGPEPPIGFALIVTGAVCAAICRRSFTFEDC